MPYCTPAEVVPIANPPNQINHLPQIVPNHSLAPSSNHPFVTTKIVNLNFLKPNDITSHHPNLSITESLSSSSASSNPSTSSSQPQIKNYPKILPKFSNNLTNNMVKVTTPVSFIPNLQLIPTTVSSEIASG